MKILSKEEKIKKVVEAISIIENGGVIEVSNAAYSMLDVCLGDFLDKDWVKKINSRYSTCWLWTGPSAIVVNGVRVEPNTYTEEVDMDWL